MYGLGLGDRRVEEKRDKDLFDRKKLVSKKKKVLGSRLLGR